MVLWLFIDRGQTPPIHDQIEYVNKLISSKYIVIRCVGYCLYYTYVLLLYKCRLVSESNNNNVSNNNSSGKNTVTATTTAPATTKNTTVSTSIPTSTSTTTSSSTSPYLTDSVFTPTSLLNSVSSSNSNIHTGNNSNNNNNNSNNNSGNNNMKGSNSSLSSPFSSSPFFNLMYTAVEAGSSLAMCACIAPQLASTPMSPLNSHHACTTLSVFAILIFSLLCALETMLAERVALTLATSLLSQCEGETNSGSGNNSSSGSIIGSHDEVKEKEKEKEKDNKNSSMCSCAKYMLKWDEGCVSLSSSPLLSLMLLLITVLLLVQLVVLTLLDPRRVSNNLYLPLPIKQFEY